MRLIDDYLPEDEILKLYIGPYIDQFESKIRPCWSPTAQAKVNLTAYYHNCGNHFKYGVSYTRTRSSVRLVLKEQVYYNDEYLNEWVTIEQWLFSIYDPDGPKEMQAILRKYSANLESSA